MGKLVDKLKNYSRIAIDTNSFIYLMERNEKYFNEVREMFRLIESGSVFAISSMLLITEVLTKPYKDGDILLANRYKAFISAFPNLYLKNIDYNVLVLTAKMRARYGLKTPDAIFIASALEEKAEAFVTNDIRLRKINEIEFIILDEI
ncbi:type II toxin-antitoxin system VapC family toxin [Caloramator australicus]|uniref:PilT protein-like n=1 Tax=Caloramator australicus RC3 TaxID=857293 RepID=I7K7E1_9CLOT|nr:type II toxin-antitoxin system VapC family toxin [Caloramator australicus]CCJ33449.1 PilT protein-like [Caloramator australicus RC3]